MVEKLKELFNVYRIYIIGIVSIFLLCWGSYRYGYSKGSQVNDIELAEQLGKYEREIDFAKTRIRDLEETNSRLEATNRSLEKSVEATERIVYKAGNSVERVAGYTDEAIGAIDRVISEMRQATEAK